MYARAARGGLAHLVERRARVRQPQEVPHLEIEMPGGEGRSNVEPTSVKEGRGGARGSAGARGVDASPSGGVHTRCERTRARNRSLSLLQSSGGGGGGGASAIRRAAWKYDAFNSLFLTLTTRGARQTTVRSRNPDGGHDPTTPTRYHDERISDDDARQASPPRPRAVATWPVGVFSRSRRAAVNIINVTAANKDVTLSRHTP